MTLLFLLGLTGVGKSTAVDALQTSGTPLTLLPNRRTLTDERLIPEVQRAAGKPLRAVSDRLERFELTRRYRELHPGGMVEVLKGYLQDTPLPQDALLVFDNLRGLGEAQAGVATFPEARFILLDAPPPVRLQRLVGRQDRFDQVDVAAQHASLGENVRALKVPDTLFALDDLLRLEREGVPEAAILKGVQIILREAEAYDMSAAATFLRSVKDEQQFLYLATAALSVAEVRAQIQAWL